jgi:hypothetical protein
MTEEHTSTNNLNKTLFNEQDVAKLLSISVATVRRWRLLQQGPRYLKIRGAVRYRPEDLAWWLASRPTGGQQQTCRSR